VSRAVIVFPDPRVAVRDLIRELLATRAEPEVVGAVVSTKTASPDDAKRTLPHVHVRSDGNFRNSRLNGRATVRIVVWHRDEGLAQRLALLIEGLLLATTSNRVRGFGSVTGPLPTSDPDTGEPISYFTLTARLRPEQL
jgi:hypothetical protein